VLVGGESPAAISQLSSLPKAEDEREGKDFFLLAFLFDEFHGSMLREGDIGI